MIFLWLLFGLIIAIGFGIVLSTIRMVAYAVRGVGEDVTDHVTRVILISVFATPVIWVFTWLPERLF